MTKRLSLFAGWCLLLLAGSLVASADAWSLYSDEEPDHCANVRWTHAQMIHGI